VNAIFLQLKCQKLVVRIYRSLSIFPPQLADILCHLMSEVEQNLDQKSATSSVAAFIFLRLVNPSILFPSQYGLVDNLPKDDNLTRQLILITKVLQNLVSFLFFSFFFCFFFFFSFFFFSFSFLFF